MEAKVLYKTKTLVPKLRFSEYNEKWKTDTLLGFNLEVIDGDRGTNYPNGDDFSSEGYCLFMSAKNVTKNGFSFEEKVFITKEKDEVLRKGKLNRNDLVLTTRGSVGNIAFYSSKIELEHLRINSGMVVIRNQNKYLDPNFIYISFFSPKIDKQLKTIAFGSAQPQLTVKEINKFKFTIPSLPEQQKIASFLTAVDEKIQQLTRKKQLLEQYKKGVMQQLFSGKLRFKDENGNKFPKWKEKKLGDICSFFSGGTPESSNKLFYTGSIPFIGSANIYDSEVFTFITEEALNNSSAKIVEKGDLLYALYGANSGEVAISKLKGAINQAILCIRSDENICYLYYNLLLNKDRIVAKYLQGGQGNLSANIIKGLKYKFPEIAEQKKIANYLSNIDNKIEIVNKQIMQTQIFKKGLLQQMFV